MAAQEPSSIYSSGALDLDALRASLGEDAYQARLRKHRLAVAKSILIVLALFGAAGLLFWLI